MTLFYGENSPDAPFDLKPFGSLIELEQRRLAMFTQIISFLPSDTPIKPGMPLIELYKKGFEASLVSLEPKIVEKEQQLASLVTAYATITPAARDIANQQLERLRSELDTLKAQATDLSMPWTEIVDEFGQRIKSLESALERMAHGNPRQKCESLRGVIDRIVCHFRYLKVKSCLDVVEIHGADGGVTPFYLNGTSRTETSQAQD
jgi:hypothetical protein